MRAALFGLSVLWLVGCGPSGPDSDPAPPKPDDGELPAPDDVDLEGTCSAVERYGGFVIQDHVEYTVVQGQVADAVVPSTVLDPIHSDGDCLLLRRSNPFCDPACEPDEVCGLDGECLAFPEPQDLGTVAVDGLVEPLSLEPAMPGYNYFSTSLRHPAMTAAETVRIRTGGGAWTPFELWGVGVESLALSQDEPWAIARGEPLELVWQPPSQESRADVYLQLTIDQHGTSPVVLECTFVDTGAATIPSTVVDQLLDAGVSGWPSARLARRTADSASVGEGCVDLVVASPREAAVTLVDYIPCDDAHPCPDGLECDLGLGLCL